MTCTELQVAYLISSAHHSIYLSLTELIRGSREPSVDNSPAVSTAVSGTRPTAAVETVLSQLVKTSRIDFSALVASDITYCSLSIPLIATTCIAPDSMYILIMYHKLYMCAQLSY